MYLFSFSGNLMNSEVLDIINFHAFAFTQRSTFRLRVENMGLFGHMAC